MARRIAALTVSGGVEADVALVEPEGTLDRIHHVADADDAEKGTRSRYSPMMSREFS
jgi:hypothetical protein